ncbi:hypothetical protein DL767_004817 [Monosporascus sp. MG133]|nr:hypothetical protein DL767_004817 [Monosporascus sp. MG133]
MASALAHLWVHPHQPYWAWLVVGSFYDSEDCELWHIEVFLGNKVNDNDSAPSAISPETTTFDTPENNVDNSPVASRQGTENFSVYDCEPDSLRFGGGHPLNPETINGFVPRLPQNPWNNPPAGMSGGWNPSFGWDHSRANAPPQMSAPNGAYLGLFGVQPPFPMQGPSFVIPQNGFMHPLPVFPGQAARFPNPRPAIDPEYPATYMSNSTGGIGCEPGYNLFHPPEYTKVHIIKSRTAPWQNPPGMALSFGAFHIPTSVALGDILKGFGANNGNPKKNRITEVTQGHNGRWYKGVTISGDDRDQVSKTLKQMGWDRSRTGRAGEKPVVWLWITKD